MDFPEGRQTFDNCLPPLKVYQCVSVCFKLLSTLLSVVVGLGGGAGVKLYCN